MSAERDTTTKRRPVKAVNLAGIDLTDIAGGETVTFEWVDPSTLLVDDAYQRALSERSMRLIRRVAGAWDWRRFKPPIVARTDAGLEVIDGQHTAIAAASHPRIKAIPVMLVDAGAQADRANAFLGHNRDRLGVTPSQMHHSAVAAGDPQALAIARVCDAAGLTMLVNTPGNGVFKPRDTMAVQSIAMLIRKRGEDGAIAVLKVLGAADCAPVSAGQIKATDMLMSDAEYVGSITAESITEVLKLVGPVVDQEAQLFAATHGIPQWKALGIAIFKRGRRGRRAA